MKKYLFFLSLIPVLFQAQTVTTPSNPNHPYWNRWRLGFNIGGAYQNADITSKAGLGGGVTLQRDWAQNKTNTFDVSFRGRALWGTTYGLSTNNDVGLKNNTALNGQSGTATNYYTSGDPFFSNYQMKFGEYSGELMFGLNRLREKTNVLAYFWGGLGGMNYKTKINALDQLGNKYDFRPIMDANGNTTESQLLTTLDNSYETYAESSSMRGSNRFVASCGAGIGYNFGGPFSMSIEHKISAPFTDLLDGHQWTPSNNKSKTNDYYNYTSLHLAFTLGYYSYLNHNSSSNTGTTVNTGGNTSTTVGPTIQIVQPSQNPYNTYNTIQNVYAVFTGVSNASQISVTQNGMTINNFEYYPNKNSVNVSANLLPGANNFTFVVNTPTGSATATQIINLQGAFTPPSGGTPTNPGGGVVTTPSNPNPTYPTNPNPYPSNPVPNPPTNGMPLVTITNPYNNYISNSSSVNVNAVIYNVANASNLEVLVNGTPTSYYSFNPSNGQFVLSTSLNTGNNSVYIKGYNSYGNDSKTVNIIYSNNATSNPLPTNPTTPSNPVVVKPVVAFVNPITAGTTTYSNIYLVNASVLNVTSQNQIKIDVNGNIITNYSYNAANGSVSFNANLQFGSNAITIQAANSAGSDYQSTSIIYTEKEVLPTVKFVTPASNPETSSQVLYNVKATTTGINLANQLVVKLNGNNVPFTFNANTITFPINLISGVNTVTVLATNTAGAATASTVINFTKVVSRPPSIAITNPVISPSISTVPNYSFVADIYNYAGTQGITVKHNGLATSNYSYDAVTHKINLSVTLINGGNTFEVSLLNGTTNITKTAVVNYQPIVLPPAEVKPSVSFLAPAINPYTSPLPTFNYIVKVTEVSSTSNLTLNYNGQVITNYSFNAATGMIGFAGNLINGANTLVVTASNGAGSASATSIINYIDNTQGGDGSVPRPKLPRVEGDPTTPTTNPVSPTPRPTLPRVEVDPNTTPTTNPVSPTPRPNLPRVEVSPTQPAQPNVTPTPRPKLPRVEVAPTQPSQPNVTPTPRPTLPRV